MARVIAFDVNETLLDLAGLDEVFTEVFGDADLRQPWFAQMLQLGFVGGLTHSYVDFTTAQHAALEMVSRRAGKALGDDKAERVVDQMRQLRPHPEVPDALNRLSASSLRVVALTNSVLDVAERQLRYAGIRASFDAVYSADTVQELKPGPAPYRHAAEESGVDVGDLRLVAAHSWDVSGALRAGCRAAFVARGGGGPSPIDPAPEIVGSDVADVVDRVLSLDV